MFDGSCICCLDSGYFSGGPGMPGRGGPMMRGRGGMRGGPRGAPRGRFPPGGGPGKYLILTRDLLITRAILF